MGMTYAHRPFGRQDLFGRAALLLLLIAFVAYGLAFIRHTSFVVAGVRSYALFDDAMISMSYARSLAEGHGLVWFPGAARIEGFTNLLWVLILGGFHGLPGGETKIPLYVQLFGLCMLTVNLCYTHLLAKRLAGGSALAGLAAVFLTAFYLPLNTWALQGTEVGALALILTASTYYAVRGLDRGRTSLVPYALLGIGTLLRLDALLPLLLTAGLLAWIDGANRKRHLVLGAASLAIFVGSQTLFRVAYFGHPLPNTYYLKMTGFPIGERVARGLRTFLDFFLRFNPLFITFPVLSGFQRPRGSALLPAMLFTGQCIYSIYVGGDAWEQWGGANRFICIAMPLLFALAGRTLLSLAHLLERLTLFRPYWTRVAVVIILLTGGATQINWSKATPGLRALFLSAETIEVNGNQRAAVFGRVIRAVTTDEATVAVVWAGNVPYFAHRPAIDLLGRCDPRIARGPIAMSRTAVQAVGFYPGHMKWDYAYSIGQLQPDVICHLWGFPDPAAFTSLEEIPSDARPYVEGRYVLADVGGYRMLLRNDSSEILWDRIEAHLVR